jgi:hypothetical protein
VSNPVDRNTNFELDSEGRVFDDKDRRSRRRIEPPPDLDPALARFIEELARAGVRRERRTTIPSIGQVDDSGKKRTSKSE